MSYMPDRTRIDGTLHFGSMCVRGGLVQTSHTAVGMVLYGVVWYGVMLCGMVWYGMVWYGMLWYGMVWSCVVWYGSLYWYVAVFAIGRHVGGTNHQFLPSISIAATNAPLSSSNSAALANITSPR